MKYLNWHLKKKILTVSVEGEICVVMPVNHWLPGQCAGKACSPEEIFSRAAEEKPDVIVVYWDMSGMTIFNLFELLRKKTQTKELPLMVIPINNDFDKPDSGFTSTETALEAS